MRKWLLLPLLVSLTGCVSYYYPETALEDGVYYAEDDPSYAVYSDSYAGVAYYPWYSVDYFYLGYYPYPRHRYGFGYGYPSGFSFGFNYGFSPWYYPSHYYGYYSGWYDSHHHHRYTHHSAWRPYRGYYSNHRRDRDRNKKYNRNDEYDRYGVNDRYGRRNHSDDTDPRDKKSRDRHGRDKPEYYRSSSVRPYVSTPGDGHSGDVRYRSDAKQTRSRIGPVNPGVSSKNLVVKTAPGNVSRTPGNSSSTRSARAKTGQQAPVRTPSPSKASSSKQTKASSSSKRSSRTVKSSGKTESSKRQKRK